MVASERRIAHDGRTANADPVVEELRRCGISERHVHMAQRRAQVTGEALGAALYALGLVSSETLARALAAAYHLPYVTPQDIDAFDASAIDGLTCAGPHHGVPFACEGHRLTLAIADPHTRQAIAGEYLAYELAFVMTSYRSLQRLYRRHFAGAEASYRGHAARALELAREIAALQAAEITHAERTDRIRALTLHSEVRQLFLALMRYAAYTGATDIQIHLAPAPGAATVGVVKMRWDGSWSAVDMIHRDTVDQLFLVAARGAGFSETRLREQIIFDGTFNTADAFGADLAQTLADLRSEVDFRIAFGYADSGPTITVRILERDASVRDFDALHMDDADKAAIRDAVATQSGLIAVTGPTGSGKTSLRYVVLGLRDPEAASIQTIENPVELRRALWMQYAPRDAGDEGGAMYDIFRGMLRNSPQVIDIAEVRHPDAYALMNRAAGTGHLVCVTLHADDAPLAVHMMRKSGVDDDDIANNISLIIAVRLVRLLCKHCRVPSTLEELPAAERATWTEYVDECGAPSATTLYRAYDAGCRFCHAGYHGLRQVAELMQARHVAQAIRQGADITLLRAKGIQPNRSLRGRGLALAAHGDTSIAELQRVMPRRRY
jgi:type II secretory ATPase GspE/PulE/Tfp pilus assembly ATPase PilB-like protein